MKTFARCAPVLFCIAINLLAQIQTIPVAPPPGTTSTDLASVVGWIIFICGLLAVILVIAAFWALKNSHMGGGIAAFGAIILCIIGMANATTIARAIWHPQG